MDGKESVQKPRSPPSEGRWMAGVRSGDPDVLKELLKQFLIPLRIYAERILEGSSDAEEAVQEAFIRLWERREHWREDGSVKTLLYTLTRNAAVDSVRRRYRERPLPEDQVQSIPSTLPTPFDEALESELGAETRRAVSGLPPRRQEVFRLIREDGFTYREAAEVLNIAPQTVANLMSLALSDLRSALSPFLDAEGRQGRTARTPPDPAKASGSD